VPQAPKTRTKTTAAPAGEAAPSRVAYLVLGMHRSGTSAVTQLLGLAGAQLPAHVMPGDEHNAKGYFEPWRIAMLNDERLRAAGGAWDDVFGFPFRPLDDDADWRARAHALFAEEYRKVRVPLLKDPRVTVLLPLWREVFQAAKLEPRCVIPVRHPLAVAGSLSRRDGFAAEKSVLLWTAYMLAAEAYTRDMPRVFVDYDALLADWRGEVGRIVAAHGAPLPKLTGKAEEAIDAFLSPDLRHNEGQGALESLGWTGELAAEVFAWFRAAAADAAPDPDTLSRAGAALAARRAEMGPLVSPTTRDLDVARHDLREARAARAVDVARLEAHNAEIRAAWTRDVDGYEAELLTFYRAIDKAEAELDETIHKS
jgi:hypothetical protein